MFFTHHLILFLSRLILSVTVLCFANNAYAHAGLEKTIPGANSTVAISPADLVLEFDLAVMLVKLALNDDGKKHQLIWLSSPAARY
jgi:methionine-rich copper-binding protein CopC